MTVEIDDVGKTIETDILILGSGAAGCGAAIGAKEQGPEFFWLIKEGSKALKRD